VRAIAILRASGDGRRALIFRLPGWHLVWSLYGPL
jgi:hypothetical protein